MRWLAAIAVALVLAGCTASNSPLQQDLRRLAELPKRMDAVGRKDGAAPSPAAEQPAEIAAPQNGTPAAGAPAASGLAVPPDQQVATTSPPPDVQQQAVPETPPPAPAQQVAAAESTAPQPAKPTFFDKLRAATARQQAKPAAGVHDQIPDPIPVENPLARPPWEVFVEAGPNAHNELDLETLYGPGNIPPELVAEQQAAEQQADASADPAAPPVDTAAATPPADDPAQKPAKPGTVTIKAVAVPSVKGAAGSGNKELTIAMRDALQQAGWPILTSARGDALTVQGRVVIGQAHGASQSVQIVWDVLTPDGKNLGNLKQDNAVPAGSLDKQWGDNARYAAEAAAEGIFTLIQKYR